MLHPETLENGATILVFQNSNLNAIREAGFALLYGPWHLVLRLRFGKRRLLAESESFCTLCDSVLVGFPRHDLADLLQCSGMAPDAFTLNEVLTCSSWRTDSRGALVWHRVDCCL